MAFPFPGVSGKSSFFNLDIDSLDDIDLTATLLVPTRRLPPLTAVIMDLKNIDNTITPEIWIVHALTSKHQEGSPFGHKDVCAIRAQIVSKTQKSIY